MLQTQRAVRAGVYSNRAGRQANRGVAGLVLLTNRASCPQPLPLRNATLLSKITTSAHHDEFGTSVVMTPFVLILCYILFVR